MLRLNCFIKVCIEKKAEVLESAKALTAASIKQEGCIGYDVFESATRPDVIMICETWSDKDALAAHSASKVFKEEVSKIRNLAQMKLETFVF